MNLLPTTELTSEEQAFLLSAIDLSSQEKQVSADLKEAKTKVIELFQSRYDTSKTGTIAKLSGGSIQVKKKAGKRELTPELQELASFIQHAVADLEVENAAKIEELRQQIKALQTSDEIEMMELDFKLKVAALPEPETIYEVAIKV